MTPELVGVAAAISGLLLVSARVAVVRERIRDALGEPRVRGGEAARPRGVRRWVEVPGWLVRWSPEHLAATSVACAVGAILGYRFVGPVGGVAGAVAGAAAIRTAVRTRAERDRLLAERQLGEFVEAISAAVRAGLSVRRALREASRDLGPPLRPALDAVSDRLDVGEPLERAFGRLAPAVGSHDARLVAALLSVHSRTGGDLPRLLDAVAEIVRQRIEAVRSVRTLTAQGRASGAVLAVLPFAFVALLSWTSGDGLGAFYRTPLGAALLSAGLLCQAVGFLWIRRIVDGPFRDG